MADSYLTIGDGALVTRSVQVDKVTLVDLDAEGRIVGIETLGHPFDMGHALAVLRWVRVWVSDVD